jgi:hypothetical protein
MKSSQPLTLDDEESSQGEQHSPFTQPSSAPLLLEPLNVHHAHISAPPTMLSPGAGRSSCPVSPRAPTPSGSLPPSSTSTSPIRLSSAVRRPSAPDSTSVSDSDPIPRAGATSPSPSRVRAMEGNLSPAWRPRAHPEAVTPPRAAEPQPRAHTPLAGAGAPALSPLHLDGPSAGLGAGRARPVPLACALPLDELSSSLQPFLAGDRLAGKGRVFVFNCGFNLNHFLCTLSFSISPFLRILSNRPPPCSFHLP